MKGLWFWLVANWGLEKRTEVLFSQKIEATGAQNRLSQTSRLGPRKLYLCYEIRKKRIKRSIFRESGCLSV